MDNFRIDITSEGDESLKKVLGLFRYKQVAGYSIKDNKLVLYWTKSSKATMFPFMMNLDEIAVFVLGWLRSASYGQKPDIDGDCGKGWRIYNEDWGRVDGDWEAFCAIEPVWALYGK